MLIQKIIKNRSARAISDESGIYLAFSAILSLAILGIFIGLALDNSLVRHARQELNLKLDNLCKEAAKRLPLHFEVLSPVVGDAELSLASLFQIPLKFGDVTEAKIILGLMPNQSISGISYDPDDSVPCNNGVAIVECDSCGFFDVCDSSISYNADSNPNGYPAGFWNRLHDSGIMIGCEATAEVKGFFKIWGLEESKVFTRSVWWRSLRGGGTVFDRYPQGAGPAVVLAIAPQLQTDSSEGIYRFREGEQAYDPLALGRPQSLYTGTRPGIVSPYGSLSSISLSEEQQENMLVASLNPPLLVRNAFASTLVELLSRSGETRNRTELLILNSKHIGEGAPEHNFPVRMVGFGDDLTDDRYQPPYLVHFNDGWLNPFDDGDSGRYRERAIFTSQLRLPFHFYHSGVSAVTRYPSGFIENADYEYINYHFREALRAPPNPNPNSDTSSWWDMPCAWGVFDIDGNSVCNPVPDDAKLTAAEVVHMLGSAQLCPSAAFDSEDCIKPESWSDDLKPDISALSNYVINPGAGAGGQALKAPGLFSFVDGAHAPGLDHLVNYSHPENPIVILILHDLELVSEGSGLDDATATALQALSSPSGRLHVVYIPSRPEGYAAVCAIQENIGLDCNSDAEPPDAEPSSGGNSFTLLGAEASEDAWPSEDDMRGYWSDLLSDQDESVRQKAINFYKHTLTTVRQRL